MCILDHPVSDCKLCSLAVLRRTRARCGCVFAPEVVIKNVRPCSLRVPLAAVFFGTFGNGLSWSGDSQSSESREKECGQLHDCVVEKSVKVENKSNG